WVSGPAAMGAGAGVLAQAAKVRPTAASSADRLALRPTVCAVKIATLMLRPQAQLGIRWAQGVLDKENCRYPNRRENPPRPNSAESKLDRGQIRPRDVPFANVLYTGRLSE